MNINSNYHDINSSHEWNRTNSGKRDFSTFENSNLTDKESLILKKTRYNDKNSFDQKVNGNKILQDSSINHTQKLNLSSKKISPNKNNKNLNSYITKQIVSVSEESSSIEESPLIKALDEFRDTENSDDLLKLMKAGAKMNTEDLQEAFDLALVNDNRQVIVECFNRGLSGENLDHTFRFGINKNDKELIEKILNGANGQIPLDFNKWCNNNPILCINTYMEKHVDEAIVNLLCSKACISKEDLEENEWRKCLANIWNIQGEFILNNIRNEYEGAFIHFFVDKILSSIQAFKFEFPGTIDDNLLNSLFMLIDESKTTNIAVKISRFKNNKPLMIHSGMQDHHMEVILWPSSKKSYLLICNKGLLSEVPVKVYSIDPTLVNENVIEIIETIESKFKKQEEAKIFYTFTLPNLLNGIPHEALTDLLKNHWIDESLVQIGENCVWESVHTAMLGAFALQAWINNECETHANRNSQETTILNAFKQIKLWSRYVGLWALGEYLNHSKKVPSKLDIPLVESILKNAESLNKERINDFQYDQILNKYKQVKSGSFINPPYAVNS